MRGAGVEQLLAGPEPLGFTPEQQFSIAWAQFRGDAIRPETQR